MPTHKSQPVSLAPDPGAHANLRLQLHAHLEVALQLRRRDGIAVAHGAGALEPRRTTDDHGVEVTLLGGLERGVLRGRRWAIDGFVQDRVVWVVLLHGGEVVGAFDKVLALAGGVFGADGLAVDALCGEALGDGVLAKDYDCGE